MWLQGGYGGCHSVLGDGWVSQVGCQGGFYGVLVVSMVVWVVSMVFCMAFYGALGGC